jgi:hypothetical protein
VNRERAIAHGGKTSGKAATQLGSRGVKKMKAKGIPAQFASLARDCTPIERNRALNNAIPRAQAHLRIGVDQRIAH